MRISDWSSDVCSSDLKASTGITEADKGSIIFDGREITHTPPHEIAGLDVRLMLGGAGTFPSLTVDENLRSAAWLQRKDRKAMKTAIDARTEERTVGQGGGIQSRTRWSPYH